MSLYAGARHPGVFGRVLAESPALVLAKRDIGKELFSSVDRWPQRVYLGMGGKESADASMSGALVAAVTDLYAGLGAAGLSEGHRKLYVDHEATHTESAWANRLPDALIFLFPAK